MLEPGGRAVSTPRRTGVYLGRIPPPPLLASEALPQLTPRSGTLCLYHSGTTKRKEAP